MIGDPAGGVDVGSAVDDEDAEVGVVLRRHRRQRVVEPRTRVAGDDDGHDRRVQGERLGEVVVDVDIAPGGRT